MTEYVKSTNFASKDALSTGNPLKIVKGTEIDTEFNNIATAVTTKADLLSPVFTGTPTAPTATTGTSNTQIATTAFVNASVISFTGAMFMWPTATAPSGFLLCNGQTVSRTTYAALFAIVGTTFGAGDGSTTFLLPDYRDRMPVGAGTTYSANSTGGSKDAIAVAHTHTFSGNTGNAGSHTHTSTRPILGEQAGIFAWSSGSYGSTSSNFLNSAGDHNHSFSGTTASTGSSGTNANLPPYLGIYFIIKT